MLSQISHKRHNGLTKMSTLALIVLAICSLVALAVSQDPSQTASLSTASGIAVPQLHDYNFARELSKRSHAHVLVAVYDSTQPWAEHFLNGLDKLFRFYRVFTTVNIFRYDINADDADFQFAVNNPRIASAISTQNNKLSYPSLILYNPVPRPALRSPDAAYSGVHRMTTSLASAEAISDQIRQYLATALSHLRPAFHAKKTAHALQETNDYIHKFYSIATTLLHDVPEDASEAQAHRAEFVRRMELNADELACTAYGYGYRRVAQLNVRIARLLAGWLPVLQGTSDLALEQQDTDAQLRGQQVDTALDELLKMYLLQAPSGRPWTKADIQSQRDLIKKFISDQDNQTLHPGYIQVLTDVDVILGAYVEKIPRIVHFIRTDSTKDRFGLVQYLSVASAYHNLKPDIIYMHVLSANSGPWWERAKKYCTVRFVPTPTHIGSKPLKLAAHQSDAIRVDVLDEMGGIYLDWDVIVWRSFDPLLNSGSPTIFGRERKVDGYDEVVGVAVILSRPKAPFIQLFRRKMAEVFDGERCYACHSVGLVRALSLQKPSWVRILLPSAFNSPGWEKAGVERMFSPQHYDPTIVSRVYPPANDSVAEPELDEDGTFGNLVHGGTLPLPMGYSMHLFESNGNFQEVLPLLTEDYIKTVDTNFNVLMRRYF